MSVPVTLRPIAQLELGETMDWYEKQREGLGLELKDEVDRVLTRIANAPLNFRPVRGPVRRALLSRFPYAIHFLPEEDGIVVLAVFHTRRNPSRLEGRV